MWTGGVSFIAGQLNGHRCYLKSLNVGKSLYLAYYDKQESLFERDTSEGKMYFYLNNLFTHIPHSLLGIPIIWLASWRTTAPWSLKGLSWLVRPTLSLSPYRSVRLHICLSVCLSFLLFCVSAWLFLATRSSQRTSLSHASRDSSLGSFALLHGQVLAF